MMVIHKFHYQKSTLESKETDRPDPEKIKRKSNVQTLPTKKGLKSCNHSW